MFKILSGDKKRRQKKNCVKKIKPHRKIEKSKLFFRLPFGLLLCMITNRKDDCIELRWPLLVDIDQSKKPIYVHTRENKNNRLIRSIKSNRIS